MKRCVLVSGILLVSAGFAPAQQKWTQGRTPDGQPDIQGVWTSYTITPFERPARWASKATLTHEEVKTYEEETAKRAAGYPPKGGGIGGDTWLDPGDKMLYGGQTSMVVDPPDGRVPVAPEAEKHRQYMLARSEESWEYMSVWDRCLTRGVPGGMFPGNNDNGYQIYQSAGFVVVFYEMIHEAHIIPLDLGRPASRLPDSVRQLNGDSHGRWDGNTLTVETTNYNGITQIATSAVQGRLRAMPMSKATRVTEKFTRINETVLNYEVTIDDPETYTRPWTARIPLNGDKNYRILEFACHEGNTATEMTLKGARLMEKAAAENKK
jgi:hypothetical protein